jgi:hypothetical protein
MARQFSMDGQTYYLIKLQRPKYDPDAPAEFLYGTDGNMKLVTPSSSRMRDSVDCRSGMEYNFSGAGRVYLSEKAGDAVFIPSANPEKLEHEPESGLINNPLEHIPMDHVSPEQASLLWKGFERGDAQERLALERLLGTNASRIAQAGPPSSDGTRIAESRPIAP